MPERGIPRYLTNLTDALAERADVDTLTGIVDPRRSLPALSPAFGRRGGFGSADDEPVGLARPGRRPLIHHIGSPFELGLRRQDLEPWWLRERADGHRGVALRRHPGGRARHVPALGAAALARPRRSRAHGRRRALHLALHGRGRHPPPRARPRTGRRGRHGRPARARGRDRAAAEPARRARAVRALHRRQRSPAQEHRRAAARVRAGGARGAGRHAARDRDARVGRDARRADRRGGARGHRGLARDHGLRRRRRPRSALSLVHLHGLPVALRGLRPADRRGHEPRRSRPRLRHHVVRRAPAAPRGPLRPARRRRHRPRARGRAALAARCATSCARTGSCGPASTPGRRSPSARSTPAARVRRPPGGAGPRERARPSSSSLARPRRSRRRRASSPWRPQRVRSTRASSCSPTTSARSAGGAPLLVSALEATPVCLVSGPASAHIAAEALSRVPGIAVVAELDALLAAGTAAPHPYLLAALHHARRVVVASRVDAWRITAIAGRSLAAPPIVAELPLAAAGDAAPAGAEPPALALLRPERLGALSAAELARIAPSPRRSPRAVQRRRSSSCACLAAPPEELRAAALAAGVALAVSPSRCGRRWPAPRSPPPTWTSPGRATALRSSARPPHARSGARSSRSQAASRRPSRSPPWHRAGHPSEGGAEAGRAAAALLAIAAEIEAAGRPSATAPAASLTA